MFVAMLIGPFWAGMLSGGGLLGAMHVLMLPAMVLACATVETSMPATVGGMSHLLRHRHPRGSERRV